ncbi:type II toxin-antitoxin system RelE/ParE family toxin [Serratia liquefaciens]|jgi:plasmid stabilization system protein ParE|uniref:type II toxin-antitoxin system RelE/ParE family toxin n=1 Tax=Serratia liquefaciens TaxID=614 RepID=UPI0021AE5BE5|nr:type II toxin-antitoxin system RelE/ParE family toxin [Serratia liquefaciens]MDU4174234.1 type II toxin-antitoxin system RelE/ParE family toxin [Serratia liquefaciens]
MAIYDYLASKNPIAAAEIDALISAAASQLSRNPSSGKVGRVQVHVNGSFIIFTY